MNNEESAVRERSIQDLHSALQQLTASDEVRGFLKAIPQPEWTAAAKAAFTHRSSDRNLIGNIAPGSADVVEILLGQPGQLAPHRVSVVPHMEDFARLAQRASEQAKSMMIYHQKN
jgi:hypothetical protein